MVEEQDPTEYAKADEDKASLLQESLNAQGLAAVQARMAPETHPDFDGKNCVECGDEMPLLRLCNGRIRCVYCQSAKELNDKRHGRETSS